MRIPLTLKHLTSGTVNSATANPVTLAIRSKFPTARTRGVLAVDIEGKTYPLPMQVRTFLHDLRTKDRFEALPEEVHKSMNKCAPLEQNFVLFSFTLRN